MNIRTTLLALLLLAAPKTFGQSYTWTGSTGNWATGANWVGGTIPISSGSTNLTFQGSASFSSTNNIADPFFLASLTLGSNPSAMNFYGGQLNFGNSGTIVLNTGWGNNIYNDVAGSNLTITGTGTGQVGFGGNFTTNGLTINNPGGASFQGTTTFLGTTTIATPATTNVYLMAQATNNGTMQVNSGTFYVTPGASSAVFTLASSSALVLNGGGLRLVGGEVHMQNGSSLLSTGTTGVVSDGLFAVDGNATFRANFVLASGTLGGLASTITYSGSNFVWQGGVIAGSAGSSLSIQTPVSISGPAAKSIDARNVTLSGTWTGGDIALLNGAVLIVGNLGVQSNNAITGTSGLNISGAFIKSTATGTTAISAPILLQNSGTIAANSGRILLTGGGTSSGVIATNVGGTIEFGGGAFNLNSFSGNFLGSFTGSLGGNFLVSGGALNINVNNATIAQNAILTLASGGTLGGSASNYTISGSSFQWTGGAITGGMGSSLSINTPAVISGTAAKTIDTRSVFLSGTWTGGDIALLNGGGLTVSNLVVQSDNAITGTSALAVNNSFLKGATTGTTTIAAPLTLSGTLGATSGRILLTGGGTSLGVFATNAGSTIEFGGGTFNLNSSSNLLGSFSGSLGGNFLISGGQVNINANNSTIAQNTTLTLAAGGTLGGSASSFTISGSGFQWTGGVVTGGSNSSVTVNSPIVFSGTATKTLDTRSLFFSTGTWSGGDIVLSNSAALMGSSLMALSNNAITASGSQGGLTISGTFLKTSGTGTTTIAAPLVLQSNAALTAGSGRILLTGGGTSTGTIQTQSSGTIEFGGGTYNLSNSNALGSFSGSTGGSFVLSGGLVNINAATSINQNTSLFLLAGGTLGGASSFTISGSSFQWQGGAIAGNGGNTASVPPIAVLSGTATKTVDARFLLLSSGTWSGGNIALTNDGGLSVGNFSALSDNAITSTGTRGLTITGTFVKSVGTGTTTISAPLNVTNGRLVASTGRILLTGGGTLTDGVFQAQGAGTMEFGGGTYNLSTFNNNTLLGNFTGPAGGSFLLSGGLLNINTSGTVNQGTTLTLVTGGTLGGSADYTVSGTFLWQGGVITGSPGRTLSVNQAYTFSGTTLRTVDTRLVSFASGTWTGGDFALTNGGALAFSGLTIQGDNTVTGTSGLLQVIGSVLKNTTTGTTTIGSSLNAGSISVQSGRILLTGGGTTSGINVASGASLEVGGGTFHLQNSSYAGAGSILVSGGQLAIDFNSPTFPLGSGTTALTLVTGGTLGGSGSYILSGSNFTWSGGVIGGSSTGTTALLGLNVSGPTTHLLDSRLVSFSGTWSGGDFALSNGATLGVGSLAVQTGGQVTGDGQVSVTGTLVKNTSSGTTTLYVPLVVNTGATASVQSGRLVLRGGGASDGSLLSGTTTIEFGGGTYSLLANSSLTGSFLISSGRLDYNNSFGSMGTGSTITLVEGGTFGSSQSFFNANPDRFLWQGGVINGPVSINNALISGTTAKIVDTFGVSLSGTWNGGDLIGVNNGGVGAGNLVVQGNNTVSSPTAFNIAGSLVKNSSTGTTTIAAPLSLLSSGTLAADSGRILLTGGGTMQGTLYTGTAGTIEFGGGTYQLSTFGSLLGRAEGGGNYLISSGLLSIMNFGGTINQNSTLTLLESGTLANLSFLPVSGTFLWQGGVVSGSAFNWAMNNAVLSGTAVKTARGATFNINSGTWSGGDISLESSSLGLSNLTVLGDHTLRTDSSLPVILGNVSKISGTGTMAILAPVLVNFGTVSTSSGDILLAGGGTISGLLNTQSGGNIDLTGGVFQVNTGSFGQNGNFGSTDGTGGTLRISQGRVNLNYSATFNNQGNLALLEGGTLGGTASSYTLAGQSFSWQGGAITGTAGSTAFISAPTLISGTAAKTLDGRSINFSGTWNGGDILLTNSATLSSNFLTIAADNTLSTSGNGALVLFNATKNTTTGTTTIAAPLTLSGTLTADSGRILLTGGGTTSSIGTFQTHAGGAIEFGGGTFNLANNLAFGSFSGTTGGDIFITGGQVNVNNATTIGQGATLTLATGGTLGGTVSNYTIASNSFLWTGGAITGAVGSLAFVNNPAVLASSGTKIVDTRTVVLNTGSWTGGDIAVNNGVLNVGNFVIQSDNALTASGTGSLVLGSATKNTTTGTTTIAAPLALSGTLAADSGRILLTGGGTAGATSLFQTHVGGSIEFGGGTFNLSNNFAFGSFSGTIGGDFLITGGRVNVNSNGATVGLGATLTLATGGTLGGTASNYTISGNSFQWTGGVITGAAGSSVFANASAVLSGSGTKTLETRNVTLTNGSWTGGDIVVNNASLSLGNFLIQSDNALTATGTGSVGLGSATKNTATGTTTIAAPIVLTGTLTADSGRILLTGGGTSSGLFQTHQGGAIEFGGGTYNLAGGGPLGSFSGSIGGDFFITGGRVNFNTNGVAFGQNVGLTLATGGTLGGAASNFVFAGNSFQWTGGIITGSASSSLSINTQVAVSGTATKTLDTRNVSLGSGTWAGGDIVVNNATLSLGSFAIQSDNTLTASGTGAVGIVGATKNTTTGTTTIAAPLTLTGTLTADSGRILLTGGGTASGFFQTHAGGSIEFGGGTYNLSNGLALGSFSGNTGGDFLITGGLVNINASFGTVNQGATLTLATGGTLGGSASSYTLAGNSFQWTGGVITGGTNGSAFVSAPAVLSGSGLKTLDTRSLALNQGTWTGGDIALNNNAHLTAGNFTIQSDATISGSGSSSFVTTGTLLKTSTTGTTTIAAAYTNLGTVAVDSGVLRFANTATNSGAIAVRSGGTLNVAAYLDGNGSLDIATGGALMGSGTIHGATTISGNLAPGNSPGNLTFESNVTVADGGTYFMDLGQLKDDSTGTAGVDWDLLTLTGNASLTFQSGSQLTLVFNGLTTPDPENPFWQQAHTWLIASLDTGFINTSGLHLNDSETSAGYFGYSVTGNDLYLNFAVIPEPSTIALLGCGALAAFALHRRRKN